MIAQIYHTSCQRQAKDPTKIACMHTANCLYMLRLIYPHSYNRWYLGTSPEQATPMRVLIVEDEADVRQYFVRALNNIRPQVELVTATDGREALGLFWYEHFDLVLSDHRMPRMTGLDLLRSVRSFSSVPFLLITADRSIEHVALAAGVTELLSKPISLVALRDIVVRYLP